MLCKQGVVGSSPIASTRPKVGRYDHDMTAQDEAALRREGRTLTAAPPAEARQHKQSIAAASPGRRTKLEMRVNEWLRRAYISA